MFIEVRFSPATKIAALERPAQRSAAGIVRAPKSSKSPRSICHWEAYGKIGALHDGFWEASAN
jgi:hypothetical protein